MNAETKSDPKVRADQPVVTSREQTRPTQAEKPGPRDPQPQPATNAEGYVSVPSDEDKVAGSLGDDPRPPADKDNIARVAHALWEAEGQPEGRDHEHWIRAKHLLEIGAGGGDLPAGVAEALARRDETDSLSDADKDHTYVRPAGRKEMDNPPSTWSKTDEEIDESFPASDPPGNY